MRSALLALLLIGCAHAPVRPAEWRVEGEGPHEQALALVEAARKVYPGKIVGGGVIRLVPDDAYTVCYGPKPKIATYFITGCVMQDGVAVAWPTPFFCGDLACSALPHELAHLAGAAGEGQADAGALLIVKEYRASIGGQVIQ